MLVARLAWCPFLRSVRFAHKTPKQSESIDKNKPKTDDSFVSENYARRINTCQVEFNRFVS